MRGFKEFLLRGNLVDLAVAVVIGVAFATVITALVKDLLTPLIAAIGGQPNFADLFFTVNKSTFLYGDFINALISFVIVAAVVYFFVVRPFSSLVARFKSDPPADPTVRECPYCLSKIPIAASKCAFCTADVRSTTPAT